MLPTRTCTWLGNIFNSDGLGFLSPISGAFAQTLVSIGASGQKVQYQQ
jgi:hypothetical protein